LLNLENYITRDCPNCGHTRHDSVRKVMSARPLEKMSWEEAKKYFVGFRFQQPFFTYVECRNCSLLYCPTYFNQKQLDELYRSMPDNLAGETEEVIGRTQSKYIDYLNLGGLSLTLLEIGSDIGLVTKEFVRRFDTSKVIAIEPNKDVHTRFKDNVANQGLIEIELFEDIVKFKSSAEVDVVIGIHVFDHLIDPVEYLKRILGLLKVNGSILIIVHDEKSLLRKILNKKWPPFCPQHPHLFNSRTITNLLKRLGFKDIKVSKTTNWFSLRHLIKLFGTIFGLKLDFLILDKLQIPLKLGNMAIVAKKA
jgi:SAM-dependent methyltransferase